MIDEQEIRDAYEAIAATALPAERVRGRLAARGREHRQRRALLVGAGALGTAAVATGIGVPLASRRPTAGPAGLPAAPAPSGRVVHEGHSFTFAPAWLPDGVGEQFRSVRPGGSTRIWLPAGVPYPEDGTKPPGVTFSTGSTGSVPHPDGAPAGGGPGERVQIGSVTGRLWVTDAAYVQWQPPESPVLWVAVRGLPDARKTALRVARSVHLLGDVGVDTSGREKYSRMLWYAMYSPWVPDRFRGVTEVSEIGTTRGWWQSLTYNSADGRYRVRISARTGPVPAVDAGAYAITREGGVTVWIPRDRTAPVNGYAPLTAFEANRMLREFEYRVFPDDSSWVGGR
jgi:hypothetical protein